MRFFEYESRAIVAKTGIPVTKHGFAKTPEDAAAIAEDIGGPVVIKSQVLTGGGVKAGGGPLAGRPPGGRGPAAPVPPPGNNGPPPRGVVAGAKEPAETHDN